MGKQIQTSAWAPRHDAALRALEGFIPRAGREYAQTRNYDYGPDARSNVSALSPWIRHRILTEVEVLDAVLAQHDVLDAEKYIQEVFWRGYFKGWLEHRPSVWSHYRETLHTQLNQIERSGSLASAYDEAVSGRTGITAFDAWAHELVETGYLHNHARMWFASIWIFTLKLPWVLGADFFYRHLLDGDPASNTCSWRWVGGLHTQGKTYLARADNIAKFTNGRFNPDPGTLSPDTASAPDGDVPPVRPLQLPTEEYPTGRIGLLMTEEDCSPLSLALNDAPCSILALNSVTPRSPLPMSKPVEAFASDAVAIAARAAAQSWQIEARLSEAPDWTQCIEDWVADQRIDVVLTARPPIGPVRNRLMNATRNISTPIIEWVRPYDRLVWPHSQKGFFGLKKRIPELLQAL